MKLDGRYLNAAPDVLQHAREMRHGATDAETRLWFHIRNRRLQGARFRRQQPIGRFIADFYCAEAKLAIELDGGGHVEPDQARHDEQRTRTLERTGITVLRFFNDLVLWETEAVLQKIADSLTLTLSLRERESHADRRAR